MLGCLPRLASITRSRADSDSEQLSESLAQCFAAPTLVCNSDNTTKMLGWVEESVAGCGPPLGRVVLTGRMQSNGAICFDSLGVTGHRRLRRNRSTSMSTVTVSRPPLGVQCHKVGPPTVPVCDHNPSLIIIRHSKQFELSVLSPQ